MDILSNYQGFRRCVVILVFDAYKVKGNPGSVERRNKIYVVYTKEAETADAYIEKTTYEIAREHRVRVVTSDGAEQLIILGHGALRLPACLLPPGGGGGGGGDLRHPGPAQPGGAFPAGEGGAGAGRGEGAERARERQEEVTAPPKQKAGPAGRPRSRGRHNRGWTGVYDI